MIRFLKLDTLIKLFSREGRKFYFFISKIVGYHPLDISIFENAFVHKSYTNYKQNSNLYHNERLEFLGDALLSAAVANILYNHQPQLPEGIMTIIRAELVSRKSLNKLGVDLEFNHYIKCSNNKIIDNTHIPGDVVEALIAAIYIDGGNRRMYNFIKHNIATKELIEKSLNKSSETNYKSELIIWSQHEKCEIVFDTHFITNDKGEMHYDSKVLLNGNEISNGIGQNKKAAEQFAAKNAIEILMQH